MDEESEAGDLMAAVPEPKFAPIGVRCNSGTYLNGVEIGKSNEPSQLLASS